MAEDRVGAEAPAPESTERPNNRALPQPQRAPRPGASSADLERLVAGWAQIKRDIKLANSRIAALLGSVDPVAINGSEVILVAPYEFHRNKLNDDVVRRLVEGEISQHLGGSYRVTCLAPEEYVPVPAGAAPEPEPDRPPTERDTTSEPSRIGPSPDDADDERRIRATKSIFEAEEIS
jgi:DNA polymerase-3 subunit gamma/tau